MDTLEKPSHYAGFWRRFAANGIDSLILIFIISIGLIATGIFLGFSLGFFTGLWGNLTNQEIVREDIKSFYLRITPFISIIVILLTTWLYYAFFESSPKQATLGKMALGLAVTNLYGEPLSFWRATSRYFLKFISSFLLCLGYLMIAFTPQKRGLHDYMVGSLVVVKKQRKYEIPIILLGSFLGICFVLYLFSGKKFSRNKTHLDQTQSQISETKLFSTNQPVPQNQQDLQGRSEIQFNALRSFLKRTTEKLLSFASDSYDISDLKTIVAPHIIEAFNRAAAKKMQTGLKQSWVIDEIRRYEDKKLPHYICIVIKGVKIQIEENSTLETQKEVIEKRWDVFLMTYLKAVTPTAENPHGFILSGICEQENPQKAREIWENSYEIPQTQGQDNFQYQRTLQKRR